VKFDSEFDSEFGSDFNVVWYRPFKKELTLQWSNKSQWERQDM